MSRYYSEREQGLALIIFLPAIGTIIFTLFIEPLASLIIVGSIMFTIWFWFGTFYELKNGLFLAKSGPLRVKIPFEEIKEVRKNKDMRSGYSLSFKRIELVYGSKNKRIAISPKNQDNFLKELKMYNPNIQINL